MSQIATKTTSHKQWLRNWQTTDAGKGHSSISQPPNSWYFTEPQHRQLLLRHAQLPSSRPCTSRGTIIITNYHPFSQLRARYGRPGGQKARRAYLATISPMSFLVSAAHTPAAYHLPIHIHINSHQYLKSLAGVTFRTRLTMATKWQGKLLVKPSRLLWKAGDLKITWQFLSVITFLKGLIRAILPI